MTDGIPAPAFDPENFIARYQAYEQRAAELHPANKASLFAALAGAGIVKVTVTFDGYGDSGQIDNVELNGDAATLPDIPVELARTDFGSTEVERRTEPLNEAIETFCYALLESTHGGWENNDGAYGEFVFDVVAGTIMLDFNYRIETSENHSYEF